MMNIYLTAAQSLVAWGYYGAAHDMLRHALSHANRAHRKQQARHILAAMSFVRRLG